MAAYRRQRAPLGCAGGVVGLLALLIAGPGHAAIVNVDEASDVCAADANPCVVAEPVTVKPGVTLDFGLRELRIVSGGRLEIGAGVVGVQCGSFTASTPGAIAVLARGPAVGGGQDGGVLSIEARGSCAAGAVAACFADTDCGFGVCAKGGGVSLVGGLEAQGVIAGSLSIRSAGDVLLADVVDLDSTDPDGDGGELDVISTLGSIVVGGRVEATSGRFGIGGIVTLTAARDTSVDGILDASGGDFDGGEIDIAAGGDVTIGGRLRADATAGEGAGGFVALAAGGDIRLAATAGLSADGHQSIDNFGGDGGTFLFSSGGGLSVAAGASVVAAGARPDGSAGVIDVASVGDATIAGALSAIARGTHGVGGSIAIRACAVEIAAAGSLANSGDGGDNVITGLRSIVARAGARVTADAQTGSNTIRHRDANNPPLLQASFVPAPVLEVVAGLPRCAGDATTTTLTTTTVSATTTTTTTSPGSCGDGAVNDGEQCDDGDSGFARGDACGFSCQWVACADPDDSGAVNASDALVLLRVAVGLESCDPCVCNTDSSPGAIGASDALRTLSVAVGLDVELSCPSCVAP